jgi:hypothetical protein
MQYLYRTVRRAWLLIAIACGTARAATPAPFRFATDTFAFPNVTVWEYGPGPEGALVWRPRLPRADFTMRCGTMVRAARQFRVHAQFDATRPPVDDGAYAAIVIEVLSRDARRTEPSPNPVVVPGYADLRAFSAAHEGLLKAAIGAQWPGYLQRGNWRMIFPFTLRHQERTAGRLRAAVAAGETPIVHVVRFPRIAINHFALLYDVEAGPDSLRFAMYDPNDAAQPLVLEWDAAAREFTYPRTPYFLGGPVRVYEVYDGALY